MTCSEKTPSIKPHIDCQHCHFGYHVEKDHLPLSNNREEVLNIMIFKCSKDLLTSVKLKGNVKCVSIEFTSSGTFYDNITDGVLNTLPIDEQGYKEVLSYFVPFIYFKLFAFDDVKIKITHVGDVEVVKTYMNFCIHHDLLFRIMTVGTYDRLFTDALLPYMLVSNAPIGKKHINTFEVKPCFISKGIAIIIKDAKGVLKNPDDVIQYVEIDVFGKCYIQDPNKSLTNAEIQAQLKGTPKRSHKISSKRLLSENIVDTSLYNLCFPLQHCLYIPLDNVNFSLVEHTKVKVYLDKEYSSDQWNLDIVYYGMNLICNMYGFGSRYILT